MEVADPEGVLAALGELRHKLELEERREGLEAVGGKDMEAKRRLLRLVQTTEQELAAQGRGKSGVEAGASTEGQVRGCMARLPGPKPAGSEQVFLCSHSPRRWLP
jgi:hypothetical protein